MMHSRITVARIPPVITTVPAVIRPILHQTLKGRATGTRVTPGHESHLPWLCQHITDGTPMRHPKVSHPCSSLPNWKTITQYHSPPLSKRTPEIQQHVPSLPSLPPAWGLWETTLRPTRRASLLAEPKGLISTLPAENTASASKHRSKPRFPPGKAKGEPLNSTTLAV